jgi:hypothetical protein
MKFLIKFIKKYFFCKKNKFIDKYLIGYKEHLLDGKYHCADGPAIEWNGYKSWWLNGLRHRSDGPAIEYSNGNKEWYLNNIQYTEEDFNNKIKEN